MNSPLRSLGPVNISMLTTYSDCYSQLEWPSQMPASSLDTCKPLSENGSFEPLQHALEKGNLNKIKEELSCINEHPFKTEFFQKFGDELATILIFYLKHSEVMDFMYDRLLSYLIKNQKHSQRLTVLSILWNQCQLAQQQVEAGTSKDNNSQLQNLFSLLGCYLLFDQQNLAWD